MIDEIGTHHEQLIVKDPFVLSLSKGRC